VSIYRIFGPTTKTQPAANNRDRFVAHASAISAIAGVEGVQIPPGWFELRNRFSDYVDAPDSALDRLIHEVLHPNGGGPVSILKSAAISSEAATATAEAAVGDRVREAVLCELENMYAQNAERNYKLLAKRYNQAADQFTRASRACDLERDGNTLVGESPETMATWSAVPGLVADLEQARHHMLAAASLCDGIPADVAFVTGATDFPTMEFQIALSMDPGKAHRRRVWESWASQAGRSRGWHQLVQLGVKLRAPDVPRVQPYKQPEPWIAVYEQGAGAGRYHDPHDGPVPRNMRPMKIGWMDEPIANALGAD
jgi:hypothetical protein